MAKKNQLRLGPFRCMYPTLAKPKAFEGQTEDQAKYGIKILIPKSDKETVKKVLDFVTKQVQEMNWKPAIKQQVIKVAKDNSDGYKDNAIVKDGDAINTKREEEDKEIIEAYIGHYVIGLNKKGSFGQPGLYDENAEPVPGIAVADTFKSGYWVNVQANAYCYPKPKAGVTLQLGAVQFVKEDEVFGEANPFDAIDIEEDGEVEL